jgi:dihydrofolate reductase
MRKIVAFIVQTVDGYYEGPNGELDWPNVDDEFKEFSVEHTASFDALLFGRHTYDGMVAFWTSDEAKRFDPEITRLMNDTPKIVFSTTLEQADWKNTRLIGENVDEEVAALKAQDGKDVAIFGSIELTRRLLEGRHVDELRLMIHPILLGAGHSLVHGLGARLPLRLTDSRVFRSGNVLLTYEPVAAGDG